MFTDIVSLKKDAAMESMILTPFTCNALVPVAKQIHKIFKHATTFRMNQKKIAVSDLVEQEQECTREDCKNLTVAELRDILREQGLPLSGSKQELINRIMKPFTNNAEECEEQKLKESENKGE